MKKYSKLNVIFIKIIFIVIFISCKNNSKITNNNSNIESIEYNENKENKEKHDVNIENKQIIYGNWINKKYADGLLKNKSIYKSINENINVISCVIKKENQNSLLILDFISEKIEVKINVKNNVIGGFFNINDPYILEFKDNIFTLKSKNFEETFIFDSLIQDVNENSFLEFYNNKLIFNENKYMIEKASDKEIVFRNNGMVENFKEYITFKLQYDFIVDFNLNDKIYLYDKNNKLTIYNYKFESDYLKLYKFIENIEDSEDVKIEELPAFVFHLKKN
jgi:hypothetical protein